MGTVLQQTIAEAPNSPSYGSFGNTKIKVVGVQEIRDDNEDPNAIDDNDSGMSSEEMDDSLKLNLSPTISNKVSENIGLILDDKQNVITKCLSIEPHCAEHRNEIPSCSKAVNVNTYRDNGDGSYPSSSDNLIIDRKLSDFIVIDLTCDVDDIRTLSKTKRAKKMVGTNRNIDCDYSSIPNVESSQSLVPVLNKELAVNTENQKLLSLSLSILLAALLQAMRCFAQFLEDIVVPQR